MVVWDRYHGFEPINEKEVLAEKIWQNKRILTGGHQIKGGEWQRAGINYISDLCHGSSGVFLSHDELATTYNVQCSFLDLLKVRLSIPIHWRRLLTVAPAPSIPPLSDFELRIHGQELANASIIGAKAMYELINGGKSTVSSAAQKWQEDREEIILSNQEEWRETCESSLRATRETSELPLQSNSHSPPLWLIPPQDKVV